MAGLDETFPAVFDFAREKQETLRVLCITCSAAPDYLHSRAQLAGHSVPRFDAVCAETRGANALWHQDGNEKLKPWGFYVHGCVDGHSRLIIYLVCTNNKRSKPVGEFFECCCEESRSDHFASLEEEIEAGIVVTDDEFIAEVREAVSDMGLGQDDGSWGIDLYCDVLLRLSAYFGVGKD
ncbi:hypothetical protein DFP72DRAFT_839507 [Ephemerocybe angulata]|uniref:Integrase core domain-containing protein n=1 Tax=Ephemerocybe angulata TaxID=980116 RepID=A0A8H6IHS3_9AGAR|nr:hypothetical protein DFP72DRAFT_839507 [Tulosesus angulatus]